MRPLTALAACIAGAAAVPALAQQSVSVDLTNVELRHATNQTRSSAPATLAPAARYRYEISGTVRGLPILSPLWFLFPDPVPLDEALEGLVEGSSAFLTGVVANPAGTHPFMLTDQTFDGSQVIGGTTVTFNATISAGIDAANAAFFSITNVTISPTSIGYLQFASGSAVVTRIPCPANFDEGGAAGAVNSNDISAFLAAWLTDLGGGGRAADHNLDGATNSADISAFLADWITTVGTGCPQ